MKKALAPFLKCSEIQFFAVSNTKLQNIEKLRTITEDYLMNEEVTLFPSLLNHHPFFSGETTLDVSKVSGQSFLFVALISIGLFELVNFL
jgi:hypothetical protein